MLKKHSTMNMSQSKSHHCVCFSRCIIFHSRHHYIVHIQHIYISNRVYVYIKDIVPHDQIITMMCYFYIIMNKKDKTIENKIAWSSYPAIYTIVGVFLFSFPIWNYHLMKSLCICREKTIKILNFECIKSMCNVYTNVIKLLATETAKNNFLKIKLLYMRWKKVNLENLKIVREERKWDILYMFMILITYIFIIYIRV